MDGRKSGPEKRGVVPSPGEVASLAGGPKCGDPSTPPADVGFGSSSSKGKGLQHL